MADQIPSDLAGGPPPPPWPRGREWWWLLPAILPAMLWAWYPLDASDTWWHLAAGRLIAQTGSVPRVEPFLYPSLGRRWIDYSWAAQWFFYQLYLLGGFTALILMRMAAVGLAMALGWLLAIRRGASPWLAAICCAGLSTLLDQMTHARPFILTAVTAGGVLLALEIGGWGGLIAALGLQLVWANLHASFMLGPALAGFLAAEATLARYWPKFPSRQAGRNDLRQLWLAVPGLLAVSLLNPNGADLFFMSQKLVSLGWDRQFIAEMMPLPLDLSFGRRFSVAGGLLLLTLAAALARGGRLSWGQLAAVAAMARETIKSRRFLFYWSILAVAPLAEALEAALPRARRPRILCGGLLAALALAGFSESFQLFLQRGGFKLGLARHAFPVAVADFMERSGITGNVLSDPEAGGYLLWRLPSVRPSTDSRFGDNDFDHLQRVLALVQNRSDWQSAIPGPAEADAMLVATRTSLPYEKILDEWAVVYWDNTWQLFLRRKSRYAGLIAEHDESHVSPFILNNLCSTLPQEEQVRVEARLRQRIAAEPGCGSAYYGLGAVLRRRGLDRLTSARRLFNQVEKAPEAAASSEKIAQARRLENEAQDLLTESLLNFRVYADSNVDSSYGYSALGVNFLILGEKDFAWKIMVENPARQDEIRLLGCGNELAAILPLLAKIFGSDSLQAREGRAMLMEIRRLALARHSPIMELASHPGFVRPPWLRPDFPGFAEEAGKRGAAEPQLKPHAAQP